MDDNWVDFLQRGDRIIVRADVGPDFVEAEVVYLGYECLGTTAFLIFDGDGLSCGVSVDRILSIDNPDFRLRRCSKLLHRLEEANAETGERLHLLRQVLAQLDTLIELPESTLKEKKLCARCQKTKPLSKFPLVRKGDGINGRRRSYCTICWPKYQREYARKKKKAR
jgi:hypothetical protein